MEPKTRQKALAAAVQKQEGADRVLVFTASDESVDRDGDVIVAEGWDLEAWDQNGPFLWQHSREFLPLGNGAGLGGTVAGDKLVLPIKFADEESGYGFADLTYALFLDGTLRAVSVGFLPKQWEPIPPTEDDPWARGYRYEKQELLELSAAAVQSNRNAIRQRALAGGFRQKDVALLVEREIIPQDHLVVCQAEADGTYTIVAPEKKAGEAGANEKPPKPKEAPTFEDLVTESLEKMGQDIRALSTELAARSDLRGVTGGDEQRAAPVSGGEGAGGPVDQNAEPESRIPNPEAVQRAVRAEVEKQLQT